ncbi:calcium-binding protein [Calothrix sp. CCY 0018]|uniref:calcium-binding protein n=1 Tax=Calothrix sp. CCY 0018 TaxID=3103864 RepID=UPI0039C68E53
MTTNQFFDEELYLANNPEVAASVKEGKHASGYDEFTQVGQFVERSGVIFNGTNGNDTVQASGQKSSVIGVNVETAEIGNRLINTETSSLGIGEIDTLLGSPGRNVFYLGDNAAENPSDFYLGNGDEDYAVIRYFAPTSEDAVYLAGKPEDYTLETVDNSVHISKNDDLIGIVEDVTKLIPDGLFTDNGLLLFAPENSYYARNTQPYFNQPAYLAANPDVEALIDSGEYQSAWDHFIKAGIHEERQTFFNGVVGNDRFFYPQGNATIVSFPITEYDPMTGAIKTATTGTGDRDHYHGSFGSDRFLLGNQGEDFYVGKEDEDYVLIGDFDPKEDQLIVAGNLDDYQLGIYDDVYEGVVYKEFQIANKDGDLMARLEDGENLQLVQIASDIPGTNALVSTEYEGLATTLPSEPIFGTFGNDLITIDKGNQLVFAGAGDDLIDAISSSGNNRLYGDNGNDTFILGQGDMVFGEDGNDRFFAQSGGGNILTGGSGADQFWIVTGEIPQETNTITDFSIGEDVMGIAGSGGDFSKLTFTQQNQDLLISFDGNNLAVLEGIQASSLNADNFVFV